MLRPMGVHQAAAPDLTELLARRGIRPTSRRLQVLEALARERDDATARTIHGRLRRAGTRVGLATVYRTLALLSEHGVVDALAHHPSETCYRLCGDAHHHHLVCSGCHRVVELAECDLGTWLEQAAARHGFVATEHRLEVTGLCSDCRGRA
jgi:Fur family transcriptional regulator, ferric uptake regulator